MIIQKNELQQYPEIPLKTARNLTNQKYNKLTPLYRVNPPSPNMKGVYWLCKCDCGNYCIVLSQNITQEKIKSCGCYNKEVASKTLKKIKLNTVPWNKKDLTGQRFGHWTVLQADPETSDIHHRKWICQCDCGTIKSVYGCNLGRISNSCGCNKYSKGEQKISELLDKYHISYQREYVAFKYATQANARFDFFINNTYLLEYDGTTHYIPIGGWNNKENIQSQQERDNIKNQWCKDNNIPLIRIPYWHLNDLKIEDLLLETSEFII